MCSFHKKKHLVVESDHFRIIFAHLRDSLSRSIRLANIISGPSDRGHSNTYAKYVFTNLERCIYAKTAYKQNKNGVRFLCMLKVLKISSFHLSKRFRKKLSIYLQSVFLTIYYGMLFTQN